MKTTKQFPTGLTPLQSQYMRIKAQLPDNTLLAMRLGHYCEFLFDDASIAAKVLNTPMEDRSGAPMSAFPYCEYNYHAAGIIKAGHGFALYDPSESN